MRNPVLDIPEFLNKANCLLRLQFSEHLLSVPTLCQLFAYVLINRNKNSYFSEKKSAESFSNMSKDT